VTEASVVGRQVHYWPGSYGSRGNSSHRVSSNAGQTGGGTEPEFGIESHSRR